MSFIAADEYIILMDHATLALDDLKRIRDGGVRTMYGYLNWAEIEPWADVYDWSPADELIERAQAADMKLLLRCYEKAPAYFPPDWYLRTVDGVTWRDLPGWGDGSRHSLLSPWCGEAMAREQSFMRLCRERFDNWPAVQLYAGVTHDGEVLLPGMAASYYDPHALANYRAFAGIGQPADLPTRASLKQQRVTADWLRETLLQRAAAQHAIFPEVWLSLVERTLPDAQEPFCGPRSGNWLRPELCRTLPAALGKDLNLLLFEVYRPGETDGMFTGVRAYADRTWVGSQFCEGLRTNTADAISRGLRGFITAPVHDQRPGRLEPWMLDTIRWSLSQWREAANKEAA